MRYLDLIGDILARAERIKTELGQRLRDIRRHLGDPEREEFCLNLGISKQSLGNYERGDNVPDATVLLSYRKALGVNVNWVLTGEGDMFDAAGAKLSENDARLLHDFHQLPENRQLDIMEITQMHLKRIQRG
ncbi:helix-turn-helix domain-containing protein [Agrobacterium vitis]|nr:helix-turn-helix domain-containing protein [Agrobacterium vitis]